MIDPNGFPQVFSGLEPNPNVNTSLPNPGAIQAATIKDRASVVKIEGRGCGGIVEGSGFIAGKGVVITNAHVVAGVTYPYIIDDNGSHRANVIWFDSNLDLAVLTAINLPEKPLNISIVYIAPGTQGAVLGYPGGGDFSAGPAVVVEEFNAIGHNIYNQGSTQRDIYDIRTNIMPGNSGGPLVDESGSVIGVVFAESTTYNHVGYALATKAVVNELHQAEASNSTVSTGTCAD
jgi:S1-C subfamily serine protease